MLQNAISTDATGVGTIYTNITTVDNLLSGRQYEVSVFASSTAGNSGVTSTTVIIGRCLLYKKALENIAHSTFTQLGNAILITAPGPISNMTVEQISENSLEIGWEPSEGTDYYIINVGGETKAFFTENSFCMVHMML